MEIKGKQTQCYVKQVVSNALCHTEVTVPLFLVYLTTFLDSMDWEHDYERHIGKDVEGRGRGQF
jgi:hypothetical protein